MMFCDWCLGCCILLGIAAMNGVEVDQDEGRERARGIVQAHLKTLEGATFGTLTDVDAPPSRQLFDDCHFFALTFRRYPSAVEPPEPLQSNNLFIVCRGELVHIANEQQLIKFFQMNLPAAPDPMARMASTKAWLLLAQELHKDGYFEFKEPEVDVEGEIAKGTAVVVPKRGDQGSLTVEMKFMNGKLAQVTTGGELMPGIRPRCQATRLLDEDPVIREITRQDILVMGRACKPYLDEVRATASPELREAIDGVWRQILRENR